jgi:hypothetical protein
MSPAFSSPRQAAAFAALLLVLLLLPALFGKSALPSREQMYSAVPWRIGPYPFLHQAIFEDKGDVDIAFMGSSTMYTGIDTPYVQAALTRGLGHPATVITAAWLRPGYDALYFTARDLLQNRKVHTIVITDLFKTGFNPHDAAPYWFRIADDAAALSPMPGESISRRQLALIYSRYYFAAILGMPRNLLGLIRKNLPDYLYSPDRLGGLPGLHIECENPADRLGSMRAETGFYCGPFSEFTPVPRASPSDACIYSPATADKFQFTNEPLNPWQLHFARKFAALAKMHGTQIALIQLPELEDAGASRITTRGNWSTILGYPTAIVGIPPDRAFAGLSPGDSQKLFYDPEHLNKNGQEYFEKLLTPALLKIYETRQDN